MTMELGYGIGGDSYYYKGHSCSELVPWKTDLEVMNLYKLVDENGMANTYIGHGCAALNDVEGSCDDGSFDDLRSVNSSSDEEGKRMHKMKHPVFNEKVDMVNHYI
ncbi:hypothetical protein Dimus_016326 [Dionaea muscipula]